jgi:predicted MFS family arabinose efflux permease
VNSVVYVQYLAVLPLTMLAAGLNTAWYGGVVALNGLIVITCELLMTKVVQHWPSRIVVIVGFALLGGGIACYALPWGPAVFVVGTLIWSLAEIIAGPTMFAYPAIAGPAHLRGRYLGSAQAMFSLGTAIGPVIGVSVYNMVGRSAWSWFALVCVVGMAAAWRGIRNVPAVPVEPAVPTELVAQAAEPVAEVPET